MSSVKTLLLALAVLLTGCNKPTPQSQHASPPVMVNTTALAAITEQRAVMLLEVALRAHQVADLDCLGFVSESQRPAGSKASVWELAAMEIHNERCGGDPAIAHMRDRYRVTSTGEVSVYDVASDKYTTL